MTLTDPTPRTTPLAQDGAAARPHEGLTYEVRTFGCQMNEYDSDKMSDVLGAAQGYTPTDDPEQADLILFNTCSVREKAAERMFSELGRFQELKQRRPDLLIAVGGCVASQEGGRIVKRAPFVDVVFGPQTLHRLPDLLLKRLE